MVVTRTELSPTARDGDRLRARELLVHFGEDSLSPFILRPDKALHFAPDGEGVVAYRLIGDTAVVSGDPVAPAGRVPDVLANFMELAELRGWKVVLWGASENHLLRYRGLGLRAVCLGEEAFVRPAQFSLEGRRVRKLRQSVNRLDRRGWTLRAYCGIELDPLTRMEIGGFEEAWSSAQPHVLGFVMSMGATSPTIRPTDVYVLLRSPAGELRGVARFLGYGQSLSLDLIQRLGELPNGASEAMICEALELARLRDLSEVSLNYAGLSHLLRRDSPASSPARLTGRALSRVLGSSFRLGNLARFDEKFFPEWRPRFLVFKSWVSLPSVGFRVLQAEGYLPEPGEPRRSRGRSAARPPSHTGQAGAHR